MMRYTNPTPSTNHHNLQFISASNLVGIMRFFLVVATIFFSASICSASGNLYVAQTAAGAASGASCSNAFPASWFNDSGNWGSGGTQIGPGTTVHLCGTITTLLSANGSGSSGNPITIRFESGAKISVPSCGNTGCLNVANTSWILIDGSPTSTPCGYVARADVPCSGIIEATNEGTGLGSSDSYGVYARGADNLEVRNLTIQNMYHHTGNEDVPTNNYAIWAGSPGNHVNVHNMTIHDTPGGFVAEAPSDHISISFSNIYNSNWCVFFSGGTTVNGITAADMHDNDCHDFANWDTTGDAFHHDGFMTAGNDGTASDVNGVDVYNNYFHGSMGSPTCSGGNPCVTAFIFAQDVKNVRAYNNLVVANRGEYAANGWIFYQSLHAAETGMVIANNTVIGGDQSGGGGACIYDDGDSSVRIENNITSNCTYLMWMSSGTTFAALNNNVYQGSSLQWRNGSSFPTTLASWRSASGGDASSQATVGSLNLDANRRPISGSIGLNSGANLSNLNIAALNKDILGTARPSSGNWDAGAYQFGSSVGQSPLAPTGLTATVQ